jgi:hypothetical protein
MAISDGKNFATTRWTGAMFDRVSRAQRYFRCRANRTSSRSHRAFLNAEQREVSGGTDRADAVSGFDADHQDADDLECIVAVPCDSDLSAAHARYVTFQMAEVSAPKELFREILRLVDGLRQRPAPE